MLDNNLVIEKKEMADYTPLPDDMYQVELLDISSRLNETYDSKQARMKDPSLAIENETVLDFVFTVVEETPVDGKSIRGRNIYMNFVPGVLYIGKKGKNDLYKIVEAMQRETVTPKQEAEGITGSTLNGFIGKQCRIVTKQVEKNGKKYMNVENLLVAKSDLAPLTAQEKSEAMPKQKDGAAEHAANAAYEGVTEDTVEPTN